MQKRLSIKYPRININFKPNCGRLLSLTPKINPTHFHVQIFCHFINYMLVITLYLNLSKKLRVHNQNEELPSNEMDHQPDRVDDHYRGGERRCAVRPAMQTDPPPVRQPK